MSFDLYVFDDPDVPDPGAKLLSLIEDESRWGAPLSPTLREFVGELEAAHPGLDENPDESPWASWPLDGDSLTDGRGCAFNIAWSHSDRMLEEFVERCRRYHLTLYDPQANVVLRPAQRRHWWEIRRR